MSDDRFRSLREATKTADTDELRDRYGDLLAKARSNRALDGSIIMLMDVAEGGEITRATYVKAQRGSYVAPDQARKYDLQISLKTGAFVSYDDVRRAAIDALGQAIAAHTEDRP